MITSQEYLPVSVADLKFDIDDLITDVEAHHIPISPGRDIENNCVNIDALLQRFNEKVPRSRRSQANIEQWISDFAETHIHRPSRRTWDESFAFLT